MSDINRELLENMAKEAVCSCWYYDLCDSIDAIDDEELLNIVNIPMYSHLQDWIHNSAMSSIDEFIEQLNECYEVNYKDSKQDMAAFNDFLGMDVEQELKKLTIGGRK